MPPQPARRLAELDPSSSEARHLATGLTRNPNRAVYHLRLALRAAERAIVELGGG